MVARIHLVITLYNRKENLLMLLCDLEKIARTDGNFCVHVSDFSSTDVNVPETLRDFEEKTGISTFLYLSEGVFSKTLALDRAIFSDNIEDNDIIVVSDVDVSIPENFFNRIRMEVLDNVAFMPHYWIEELNIQKKYATDNQAYGIAAAYAKVFREAGGYNQGAFKNKTTWGHEETHFRDILKRRGVKIIRAYDTGLIHRWHPKPLSNSWYHGEHYKSHIGTLRYWREKIFGK